MTATTVYSGYVVGSDGRVLVQTVASGEWGFELWQPPAWGCGLATIFVPENLSYAPASWTPIDDDDPRIPWRGFAREYADWSIAQARTGHSIEPPWQRRYREHKAAEQQQVEQQRLAAEREITIAVNAHCDAWDQYLPLLHRTGEEDRIAREAAIKNLHHAEFQSKLAHDKHRFAYRDGCLPVRRPIPGE